MSKKIGGPTNSVSVTPARRKREAKRRKAQEQRWAAKNGPVTVTHVEPDPPKP